jgi:hypothetical protein
LLNNPSQPPRENCGALGRANEFAGRQNELQKIDPTAQGPQTRIARQSSYHKRWPVF